MSSDSLVRRSLHRRLRRSSTALRYPEWQRPYQEALFELSPKKLAKCVADAETAIFERLQHLSESQDGGAEREFIQGAICALKIVKRDSLNFPDWESDSLADRQAS
jgi:hypothetical protein